MGCLGRYWRRWGCFLPVGLSWRRGCAPSGPQAPQSLRRSVQLDGRRSAIGGGYLAGAYSWGTLALLAACAGRLELSELSFQLGIGLLTGIALPFLLLGLALPPGSEHGGRFFPAAAALAGPGIVTLSLGRGAGVAFLLGAVLAGFPLAGVLSGMEGEGEAAGQQLLLLLEIGGAAGLFWSTFPYL